MKNYLLSHEGLIYLLSAATSLTFGVVVLTLRRNAIILREKKWAMPFAVTFFVLAGIYSLRLLELSMPPLGGAAGQNPSDLIEPFISLCSGVTNYLFIQSALRLAEPTLNKRRLPSFLNSQRGRAITWAALLLILCLAGLMRYESKNWGVWAKAPDAVFSAFALSFMGYVLHTSISGRHDQLMAKMALLASFGYAVLYLSLGLGVTQLLVELGPGVKPEDAATLARLVTSLVSLLLKFGIFLPGYSLMLLVSGPLEGVDRLLEPVTRKNKEYLESEGVVKSVRDELRVNSVRLYIKRPGPDGERVVLCAYPPLPPAPGDNNQEPREVKYERGAHYDRVLKTGEPYIDSPTNLLIRRVSEVAVPVRFHTSVNAVLYADRGERNFTEADLLNLKRIATMVSPAVQAYREMDALRQVGKELSQLQIKVKEYDMLRDVGKITARVHDAISPLATGVSIETGFAEYQGIYPPDGRLEELVKRRLAAPLGEEDETDERGDRWFTMGLKITIGNANGEKDGEQVFGKFIFLPESEEIKSAWAAVGTNPTFRRVLSDLLTETLLNFIRGRLNRLTDKLGSRLSGLKTTDTESWRTVVEEMAREARLLWVVVADPEMEDLLGGDDETVKLVERLESPEARERWELKAENLWLYPLEGPPSETCHVIKKYLRESRATLWFGVGRQGFGHELDYVSPWRYFLEHFCEIADSALRRIQMMKREVKQNSDMLLVSSMFGETIDAKTIFHEVGRHAQRLVVPLNFLLKAVNHNGHRFGPEVRGAVDDLEEARRLLDKEINRLKDAARRNNRIPCSLNEVIADIRDELMGDLERHDITLHLKVPQEATVHARYGIVRSALKNLVVNAIEALQSDPSPDRKIWITAEPATGRFICEVSDNGPGVSDDVKPTLLKAVSTSAKTGSHGVGLLLSRISFIICGGDILHLKRGGKDIAHLNGKRGATFRIDFPKEKSSSNGHGGDVGE